MINHDHYPIDRMYVDWANTLDSTGEDSGPARERLDETTLCQLLTVCEEATDAGTKADILKKWIFYGKESNVSIRLSDLGSRQCANAIRAFTNHNTVRIFHAILGLVGEASELLEMFMGHVFDDADLDMQNLVEESGDLCWYLALIAKGCGFATFDEFMLSNKAKLTARYGRKWTQDAAINRDTKNEMAELDKSLDDNGAKAEILAKYPSLDAIVSQLAVCGYQSRHCEDIENNAAFMALRHYAYEEFQKTHTKDAV